MIDPVEWLGTWEPARYFGKHEHYEPVTGPGGYVYDYQTNGNLLTAPVIRAIPVDGWVGLSWTQSPQVKFWLDKPEPTILERIMDWLNK